MITSVSNGLSVHVWRLSVRDWCLSCPCLMFVSPCLMFISPVLDIYQSCTWCLSLFMPDDLSVYGSMFYPTMLDIFMIIITKYRKFIFLVIYRFFGLNFNFFIANFGKFTNFLVLLYHIVYFLLYFDNHI